MIATRIKVASPQDRRSETGLRGQFHRNPRTTFSQALRPINADFSEQLALIPDVDIELTKLDEDFCFFWGHVTDPVLLRRRAGEWLLSQRLTYYKQNPR